MIAKAGSNRFWGEVMEEKKAKKYPFIPLRGITVFPNMILSFSVSRNFSLAALEAAQKRGENIFLATQKDPANEWPDKEDVYEIGTVVSVRQVLNLPGNLTHVIVEGLSRGRILDVTESPEHTYLYASVELLEESAGEEPLTEEQEAAVRLIKENYEQYMKLAPKTSGIETVTNLAAMTKPGLVADVIAIGMNIPVEEKQQILNMTDDIQRFWYVFSDLNHELAILKLKQQLKVKVKDSLDKAQKEYYLREELKIIQEELGDKDGVQADAEKYLKKAQEKNLPDSVMEIVKKEVDRMKRIPASAPDSNVAKNYIECILDVPWTEETKQDFHIQKAEKILDQDHYGLEKVKERILEYLAVYAKAPQENSPILCLVGPPGVGKTSIAKSIAKALDRRYVRMSLGGIKDEAEIRGHRRTYVGAMPGRIISAMKQAGVINPLMLLDEVDKLGVSYNGDPAAALLEVLDAEQNYAFRDHYLEIPYDLSKVFFICTANSLDTIPSPLRDRMEIIQLSSYTFLEKKHIALRHLYPKQLKKYGLTKRVFRLTEDAVEEIIEGYTREAGVRQLERIIGSLCRKAVKEMLYTKKKSMTVKKENLESLLGPEKIQLQKVFDEPQVGVVRGLAWTQVGGDTLSIEANVMDGKGRFEVTGSLGDVMKESAHAAMSYIRSNGSKLRLDPEFYKNKDVHIHIPEGAVPKDGPSAGVTMATALISALTGVAVKNDVAMTGEITIRGRVLPIGGLKEKVIAAKRAGVTTVILPTANKGDLDDLPEDVKEDMDFVLAKDMSQVLDHAFVEGGNVWR